MPEEDKVSVSRQDTEASQVTEMLAFEDAVRRAGREKRSSRSFWRRSTYQNWLALVMLAILGLFIAGALVLALDLLGPPQQAPHLEEGTMTVMSPKTPVPFDRDGC